MTWILHLHYIHNHKRRRGRWKGPWTSIHFEIFIFPIIFLAKKGCLLSFERKKWNFTIFVHPTKVLGFTWKILPFTPLVHNVWLIMDNSWTTVLWSGSTKLCNSKPFRWLMLKNFFGLHIKSLIDLKMFGAYFGIGGAIAPLPPPLGYAAAMEYASAVAAETTASSGSFTMCEATTRRCCVRINSRCTSRSFRSTKRLTGTYRWRSPMDA